MSVDVFFDMPVGLKMPAIGLGTGTNLELDYVDLYLIHFPIGFKHVDGQIHGPGSKEDIDETFDHIAIWKKMEEQVDAGRTRAIGLSNFNQRQIERIMNAARIKPVCLQVELHVHLQQRDLVKYCQKNGIVVVAYTPLLAPGSTGVERKIPSPLQNVIVKKIAAKYGKTSAQILLRKNVAVIPKSSNPERLKENIDIFDFNIDSEDMLFLDELEAGEVARLRTFRYYPPGFLDHPEYPYPK
ncbi:hypothetical protein NQ318_021938 [Aromia moschata]|uniref:NADP-dependent oxidoreductase domain-containing protein n=1 Tax=Aromia moschata TaxID=1265417 RepID=A0AAV8XCX8_9CUCU|nr:hypothetical protein NQ318_021938 [Aromia moschata]